jgi:hypothetical protein
LEGYYIKLKIHCDWCGQEFERKKSQIKDKNYYLNNGSDNLLLITMSEHSKIHAAQKERDVYGRFIKSN